MIGKTMEVGLKGHGYGGVSQEFLHEFGVHALLPSRVAHACLRSWKHMFGRSLAAPPGRLP